jgi:hypothetical protein
MASLSLFHIYLISIAAILAATSIHAAEARFTLLDNHGLPLSEMAIEAGSPAACARDRLTGLVWELKTRKPGLHHRHNTYRWLSPDNRRNGGVAQLADTAACSNQPCDTHQLILAVNRAGWCGARDWRLPGREELRSLVDYRVSYPGPTLDSRVFANAVAQFYWSADTDAMQPEAAWGIGFAFGFDYAYYKSNHVHVRLVRGGRQ